MSCTTRGFPNIFCGTMLFNFLGLKSICCSYSFLKIDNWSSGRWFKELLKHQKSEPSSASRDKASIDSLRRPGKNDVVSFKGNAFL